MVMEFAVFASLPWLLGRAIDSLLTNNHQNFVIYATVSILALVLGFSRRRLDTRVFRQVWVNKSLEALKDVDSRGVERPFMLNRAGMVSTYGDFFEFTVPCVVSATIEFVVAFAMISAASLLLGGIVGGMAAIVMAAIWIFSGLVQRNERKTQTIREEADRKIVNGEMEAVVADYERLRKQYVHRSDLDAACWRLVHLFWILAELTSILMLVEARQSCWTIMATMLYVGKCFDKAGQFTFFFNHLKHIQTVNQVLKKD